MRFFFLSAFIVFCCFQKPVEYKKIQIVGYAQGTTYHLTYYASDSLVTKSQLDSIFSSIDSSLSLYKPYSLVNQFNQSQTGLVVDKHLKNVVNKAIETFKQTNGIFDITIYPLTEAWGFGVKKISTPPTASRVKSLKACVNSNLLSWSGNKLVKKKPCVRLDPNGIAQGYTVDVIADFLEKNGIINYIAEVGGEIRVKGRKFPENEAMKIGIELPGDNEFADSIMQQVISIDSGAVTTSGSYRKFYETKGKKISHILDARTGMPAQNELISVTVIAKDGITADAFDNALMAMGLSKALKFVEARKDMSAHFIYRLKNGVIKDTASLEFYRFLQQ